MHILHHHFIWVISVVKLLRILFPDSSLTGTHGTYSVLDVLLLVVSWEVLGAQESFTLVYVKACPSTKIKKNFLP